MARPILGVPAAWHLIQLLLSALLSMSSATQLRWTAAGSFDVERAGRQDTAATFSYAERSSRLRSLLQSSSPSPAPAPSSFSGANCIVQAYNCPGCQTINPQSFNAIIAGNCTALTAFSLYLCNNETLISQEVVSAVATGQCSSECLQSGQQQRCSSYVPAAPALAPSLAISAQLAPSIGVSAPGPSSFAAPPIPMPSSPAPPPSDTTFQLSPVTVASPSPTTAAGPSPARTVSAAGPASAIQFAGATSFAPVAPASGPALAAAPTCPAGTQQPLWACGCTSFTTAAYTAIRTSAAAGTCADQSSTLALYICGSHLVQPTAYQAIVSGSCRLLCDQQMDNCSLGTPGPAPGLLPQAATPAPATPMMIQPPAVSAPAPFLAACPPGSGQPSYQCGCATLTPAALSDIQQARSNGSCTDRSADLGIIICGSMLVQPDTYMGISNGSCSLQCGTPSQVRATPAYLVPAIIAASKADILRKPPKSCHGPGFHCYKHNKVIAKDHVHRLGYWQ